MAPWNERARQHLREPDGAGRAHMVVIGVIGVIRKTVRRASRDVHELKSFLLGELRNCADESAVSRRPIRRRPAVRVLRYIDEYVARARRVRAARARANRLECLTTFGGSSPEYGRSAATQPRARTTSSVGSRGVHPRGSVMTRGSSSASSPGRPCLCARRQRGNAPRY